MDSGVTVAARYRGGSTMVVRTWFGEYVIAPLEE